MISMSINHAADFIIALPITENHGNEHHAEDRRVHLKKKKAMLLRYVSNLLKYQQGI